MAIEMYPTPMLDQLEGGPWPSFVTGLKRQAKDKDYVVDLLGQLEHSYTTRKGYWKGSTVGVFGYGGGVIPRFTKAKDEHNKPLFPAAAEIHTLRVMPPAGMHYNTDVPRKVADIWQRPLSPPQFALTLVGGGTRVATLRRNRSLRPKSTLQTAIGVPHPKIAQIAQGLMGGSFNTREFFHGATPIRMPALKWAFLLLAFAVSSTIIPMSFFARRLRTSVSRASATMPPRRFIADRKSDSVRTPTSRRGWIRGR